MQSDDVMTSLRRDVVNFLNKIMGGIKDENGSRQSPTLNYQHSKSGLNVHD